MNLSTIKIDRSDGGFGAAKNAPFGGAHGLE